MLKILVVIDMQNDFIDGVLGTKEAQAIVPKVVNKIKEWDGPIYYTMDTHKDNYLQTYEGLKLPIPHCIADTQGWELNPLIEEVIHDHPSTQVIEKNQFATVTLASEIYQLRFKEGYTEVHLCGVCTDICVVSNALLLKSYLPCNIVVDAACCAGTTPDNHEMALKIMKQCQIDIENWSEVDEK